MEHWAFRDQKIAYFHNFSIFFATDHNHAESFNSGDFFNLPSQSIECAETMMILTLLTHRDPQGGPPNPQKWAFS